MPPELSTGDFVYQSDQELFLVVIGEDENSYQFAVHGWRNIDKERLEEYIDHDNGKLYKQEDVIETVEDEASDEQAKNFEILREMFSEYSDEDIDDDGPHVDFALDDS